jgi:transcriptional antiterminator RfaH
MSHWYLVHTKIRQEATALENLERQGFQCFLPLMQLEKLRRNTLQVVHEPMFPRYLFIRLGSDVGAQSWAPIRSTQGVSRLVTFGQTPAKVQEELVEQIRAQCDQGVQRRHFVPGEKVEVSHGRLPGWRPFTKWQMAKAG